MWALDRHKISTHDLKMSTKMNIKKTIKRSLKEHTKSTVT